MNFQEEKIFIDDKMMMVDWEVEELREKVLIGKGGYASVYKI